MSRSLRAKLESNTISVRLAEISVPKSVTPRSQTTIFNQEGYDLMAAAFEVYNELGYGLDFGKNWELESKQFVVEDLHVRTKGSSREH